MAGGAAEPPPPVRLSHFGVFARDPAKLGRFYEEQLGFTVTDQGDLPGMQLVFLSRLPEEHHQLVLCSGAGPSPPGGYNTVNQISLRVDSLDALRALERRMAAVPGVTDVSLYFRDPEGNRIECYLDSPWYCAQPQRVVIDLAQTDAQIWRLVEQHARSQPRFKPREVWLNEMRAKMQSRL